MKHVSLPAVEFARGPLPPSFQGAGRRELEREARPAPNLIRLTSLFDA